MHLRGFGKVLGEFWGGLWGVRWRLGLFRAALESIFVLLGRLGALLAALGAVLAALGALLGRSWQGGLWGVR